VQEYELNVVTVVTNETSYEQNEAAPIFWATLCAGYQFLCYQW